jgi:hypothetical protein
MNLFGNSSKRNSFCFSQTQTESKQFLRVHFVIAPSSLLLLNSRIRTELSHSMLESVDSDPTTATTANTMTSYVKYPEDKPFVNTAWVHLKKVNIDPMPKEPYHPHSKAFPESNRDCKKRPIKSHC